MLSPIAVEILQDMEAAPEFAKGACVTSLMDWLGASKEAVRVALDELVAQRLVYRVKNVFYHHTDMDHAPVGVRYRAEILAGVTANKTQTQIARELGICKTLVHRAIPGRRHAA